LDGERIEEFKAGKVGFPSVRINAETIIDLFPVKERAGEAVEQGAMKHSNLNHFCLVVEPDAFEGLVDYLEGNRVTVREGPISRWGARGRAMSVYFFDPDGNEIEIRRY
jgi:catechol 2,3-dioxygenase-like lactoylglutathione lyase family enzyme